jgi:hypothetical protein
MLLGYPAGCIEECCHVQKPLPSHFKPFRTPQSVIESFRGSDAGDKRQERESKIMFFCLKLSYSQSVGNPCAVTQVVALFHKPMRMGLEDSDLLTLPFLYCSMYILYYAHSVTLEWLSCTTVLSRSRLVSLPLANLHSARSIVQSLVLRRGFKPTQLRPQLPDSDNLKEHQSMICWTETTEPAVLT